MQDYNTIVGVIQMRLNECSFPVIRARYHIGTSTIQLILSRYVNAIEKVYQVILKLFTTFATELVYHP